MSNLVLIHPLQALIFNRYSIFRNNVKRDFQRGIVSSANGKIVSICTGSYFVLPTQNSIFVLLKYKKIIMQKDFLSEIIW